MRNSYITTNGIYYILACVMKRDRERERFFSSQMYIITSFSFLFQGGLQELKVSSNPNDAEDEDCDFVSILIFVLLD